MRFVSDVNISTEDREQMVLCSKLSVVIVFAMGVVRAESWFADADSVVSDGNWPATDDIWALVSGG